MKVLITGGSGFIGINIAELLLESGEHLAVLYSRSRPPRQAMEMMEKQAGTVIWEQGDVQDESRLNEVMKKHSIDHVVHAAVITPNAAREREQMQTIIQVNCLGTLRVLAAAEKNSVRRFVYVSSVAVYGDVCQKEDPVLVDARKNPSNTYEITKYATELLCRRFAALHGNMDVVSLRLGDVYGAWEYRSGVRDTMSAPCQAVLCALQDTPVRMKKAGATGWVYGKDTARAVVALLEAEKLTQFAYNCGGKEKWSVVQFCEELKKEYPNLTWTVAPDEKEPNVTFFSEADNGLFDMEQLTKDTGFEPIYGLREGCRDYLAWLKCYPELVTEMPER